MTAELVSSLFAAEAYVRMPLEKDFAEYTSPLPEPFVFSRTVVSDRATFIDVVELDNKRFPEVWDAFKEGAWLEEMTLNAEAR